MVATFVPRENVSRPVRSDRGFFSFILRLRLEQYAYVALHHNGNSLEDVTP